VPEGGRPLPLWEIMLILRWDCAIQRPSNSVVTGSRSGEKEFLGSALTLTQSAAK
jgi:hypothetical protein